MSAWSEYVPSVKLLAWVREPGTTATGAHGEVHVDSQRRAGRGRYGDGALIGPRPQTGRGAVDGEDRATARTDDRLAQGGAQPASRAGCDRPARTNGDCAPTGVCEVDGGVGYDAVQRKSGRGGGQGSTGTTTAAGVK